MTCWSNYASLNYALLIGKKRNKPTVQRSTSPPNRQCPFKIVFLLLWRTRSHMPSGEFVMQVKVLQVPTWPSGLSRAQWWSCWSPCGAQWEPSRPPPSVSHQSRHTPTMHGQGPFNSASGSRSWPRFCNS